MRILHIIASVNPEGGGPIEGVIQLSLNARPTMYDVNIASLDIPTSHFVQTCPIKVHALGKDRSALPRWWRYLPFIHYGYAPNFVPWLRKNAKHYDIVVVNGLWNYATFGARSALIGSGVPYVVFTHGMLDPWFKKTYPLKSLLKQVFWWFCEGPLLRNARAVLFTTEEERVLAHNAFWPYRVREKVVGYGTSDRTGDPDAQRVAFRALVPSLGNRRYFLFLSRIHPKKGCDLLVEAFGAIANGCPDIDLVIAGPDPTGWRKELEARALALGVADRIHWPGMLTGDAKWGAFLSADTFILPSHQENFGVVVAEAMAASKSVLITDKVNIWREVAAAGAGIVETDDLSGNLSPFCALFGVLTSRNNGYGTSSANGVP